MKIIYNPDVDVLRIILNNEAIAESDEGQSGIIFDYDKAGNVIGFEILDASKRIENPQLVEYSVSQ